MSYFAPGRPGILNAVAPFSFILSFLNVIYVIAIGAVASAVGVAGWLLGPVVGVLGSLVAALVVFVLLVQSVLSVLLFAAAWKTWKGEPGGRSLHLTWAWIIVVIDLIDLAFTAGIDGGAWVRLIYAAIVILVMSRDDVRSYFDRSRRGASYAKPGIDDDWA